MWGGSLQGKQWPVTSDQWSVGRRENGNGMEGKRYTLTSGRWHVGFRTNFGRFDWNDMWGAVSPRVIFYG